MRLELYREDCCWSCGGNGQKQVKSGDSYVLYEELCFACDGWGTELGPDGVALVQFIEERFGLTMKKGWPHNDH